MTIAKLLAFQKIYATPFPIVQQLSRLKNDLEAADNIVIKVGTGSGKSTIVPPYLVCLGYKKVYVTQPRRMACRRIYEYVSQNFGYNFTGYSYSGYSKNDNSPLQYITDGLLKEVLYRNINFIKDIDILMIDEIHERTKNIDFILAYISHLRKVKPTLKIILCSATVNEDLIKVINSGNSTIFKVTVPSYPVT